MAARGVPAVITLGVVIVVSVGVVAGVGTLGQEATSPRDTADGEVVLPDDLRSEARAANGDGPDGGGRDGASGDAASDAGPEDPDDAGRTREPDGSDSGGAGSSRLTCEPAGCERWRIQDGSLGRLTVGDDALVYVDIDQLTVVDVDTARIRYQGPIELADGQPPESPPRATHVDDDLLVLAYDGQVAALEPANGRLVWSVDTGGSPAQMLSGHDGDLFATGVTDDTDGSALVGSRPGTSITVVSADGRMRWQDEVDMVVAWPWIESSPTGQAEDDILLVVDGDELVRRSLTDGRSHWRRSVGPGQQLVGWQPPILSHPDTDELEVVDTATGEPRSHFVSADPAWAHPLGPWVQVGTDDAIHVHDPDTGRELFRRERADGVMPGYPGRAVEVGDGADARIAVAWSHTGADVPPSIEVHRPDGSHVRTIEIPAAAAEAGPPRVRQLEPVDDGRVRVVAGDVVFAEVDLGSGEVHDTEVLDSGGRRDADARPSYVHDGLVIAGGQDELVLAGPAGKVRVEGRAPAVERRDPLIVRDGSTLLRIDERLLGRW